MKLIRFDAVESTNDETFRHLEHSETVAVSALTQTAGRGRNVNRWESPRGNIYLSVGTHLDTSRLHNLSVRVAVHVVTSLAREVRDSTLSIKWPNDIFLADKKVGGILVESKVLAGTARVVVGIGLNYSHAPISGAISLTDVTKASRSDIEELLVPAILTAFTDTDHVALRHRLTQLSWFKPEDLVQFVEQGGKLTTAIFEGFDDQLAMRVRHGETLRSLNVSVVSRIRSAQESTNPSEPPVS